MQMYNFEKGRQGILVSETGLTCSYYLTADTRLYSDDLVIDPIRMYNNNRNKNNSYLGVPRDPLEITAERLALQGYSVFVRYNSSGKRYGFAVIIDETDSEFD